MKKHSFIFALALAFLAGPFNAQAQVRQSGTPALPASATADFWRDGGKPNTLMTGGGNISFDANLNLTWSQRFIMLGGGLGAGTNSTSGHFDVNMPAAGTVITGLAGQGNITVTAAGIPFAGLAGSWGALYVKLPTSTQAATQFFMVGYTAAGIVTPDMVLVAAFNNDNRTLKLGTGEILAAATGGGHWQQIAPSVTNNPSPSGLTWYAPVPTAYGIYETAGGWAAPYQQLRIAFSTGIELNAGPSTTGVNTYGKDYVNVLGGAGLMVTSGRIGVGLTAPLQSIDTTGNIRAVIPNYATSAAAVADTALPAGSMYTVTTAGAKQLFIK
jgi:hypothetical protein